MVTPGFVEKVKHCTHDEMVALCFEATYKVKTLQRGQPLGAIPAVTDIFQDKMKDITHAELVKFCFDAVQESRRLQKETDDGSERKKRKHPSTTVEVQPEAEAAQSGTIAVRCKPKDFLIPKRGPAIPQLTVRFDSAIEKRLQPILVQCISQARILLERCENFRTLKQWLKFPLHEFPQWEDDFYITWGEEGELAIYVHEVGPDCYSQGRCVAVIRKTEDETATSSSS